MLLFRWACLLEWEWKRWVVWVRVPTHLCRTCLFPRKSFLVIRWTAYLNCTISTILTLE